MNDAVKRIVIVGGGSAGWLTAGVIAAEHAATTTTGIEVILLESPDIRPIGVGEGTWPSMRNTLQGMGVSETDFIRECDASFKQGSRFAGWVTGAAGDGYYHPFSAPINYQQVNLVSPWQKLRGQLSFADAVSAQSHVCDRLLAPKQIATPEYAFSLNYGYHLDAGKFANFLQRHCVEKLGVKHLLDHVTDINDDPEGYIESLNTKANGTVPGDLFIDCTGFSALLIGRHYKIPFISKKDILFNDTALAVQVPWSQTDSAIPSCTLSTAQAAGWIWDIGLPSRRGVGYVYSSAHSTQANAEQSLRKYIQPALGAKAAAVVELRKLDINPGYRQQFWHKNCVAVGLSAGFLEPLEASALVLAELSAKMISDQLPVDRATMSIIAGRFNRKFSYHWERIIDFLKLHYVLTQRTDTSYWRDNCDPGTIPASLQELVSLWRHQSPWHYDTSLADEMFPSASFQYIAYGMGFSTDDRPTGKRAEKNAHADAGRYFKENALRTRQLLSVLPGNRELIDKIKEYGLQAI